VAIIDGGKILVEGSPDALIAEHAPGNGIEVRDPPPELAAGSAEGGVENETTGDRLLLRTGDGDDLHREVLDRWPGAGLHLRRGSLEDVFLKLTGRELRE